VKAGLNEKEKERMFYKAQNPGTGKMWDVWMYHHAGTYYLYSLCGTDKAVGGGYNNISLASSPDGVHWNELGPVITVDALGGMGTGSTWRNPVETGKPRFQMNYSLSDGGPQRIFFAQSDDLIHWNKCDKGREFVQDERWYDPKGRWDCIWAIPRPGGGYYGYWTATPKKQEVGGPRFGFGESLNGMTWKALEPPRVEGIGDGEVGAVAKIADKYIMLFALFYEDRSMHTLIADNPQGPFKVATKNRVSLSGHTYFARFFPSPSGLLVCHQSIARDWQVSVGLLKGTRFDADGALRLTWWLGNEALKHEAVKMPPMATGGDGPIRMMSNPFDITAGLLLECELRLPKSLGAPRGLYIEHGKGVGTAIVFNYNGRAEFGQVAEDGSGFTVEKIVDRETLYGDPARLRLILEGVLLETYLDDILIECYSLPAPATGRIGLISDSHDNVFSELKAWK